MALTRRQREVFEFVRDFIRQEGYSPSLHEIGEHFGLSSPATVHKHVQHLVEKGLLRKGWNRSRSVEPLRESEPAAETRLPLLGVVAAGAPLQIFEQSDEYISVPPEMVGRGESYVLQVRGDSMIEDHIEDGDYVVVEQRQEAREGETVVALVNGEEATLKRFYRRGAAVVLKPANSALKPIRVPAENVQIRGVVRGLLRRYQAAPRAR